MSGTLSLWFFGIACDFRIGRQSGIHPLPLLSLLFMSGTLSLWVFGIACDFRVGRQSGIHPLPLLSLLFMSGTLSLCFFGIASDFSAQQTERHSPPSAFISAFYVECFFAVVFLGLPLAFGSSHRMAFNPTHCYLVFR